MQDAGIRIFRQGGGTAFLRGFLYCPGSIPPIITMKPDVRQLQEPPMDIDRKPEHLPSDRHA